MKIIELTSDNEQAIQETAALLVESFKVHYPEAWPDLASALEEVRASFAEDRISRIAIDEQGHVLGWIGGISMYDGNVWELHPLGVKPEYQGQGVGRALVIDFEEQVRQRGGLTIYLGSDDDDNQTSLSGVNLYQPNVLEHLANIKNPGRHPYEFYQKLGFVIVGVLPDANGPGRPDIFMAKRVSQDKA